jgi:hypothetical protein
MADRANPQEAAPQSTNAPAVSAPAFGIGNLRQAEREAISPTAASAPAKVQKVTSERDVEAIMADANDAIAGRGIYKGKPKDPAKVKERLKAMGINLKE